MNHQYFLLLIIKFYIIDVLYEFDKIYTIEVLFVETKILCLIGIRTK